MDHLDSQILSKFQNPLVAVEFGKVDFANACVDDQFEAVETGRGGHVDLTALEPDAVACRLNQGIGFCVNSADAVPCGVS